MEWSAPLTAHRVPTAGNSADAMTFTASPMRPHYANRSGTDGMMIDSSRHSRDALPFESTQILRIMDRPTKRFPSSETPAAINNLVKERAAGRTIFMNVELVRYPHSLAPVDLLGTQNRPIVRDLRELLSETSCTSSNVADGDHAFGNLVRLNGLQLKPRSASMLDWATVENTCLHTARIKQDCR
jgi:hypothetical protein